MKKFISAVVLSVLATQALSSDMGGSVQKRAKSVVEGIQAGHTVEIKGQCHSACTMNLAYDQNLCFHEGSYMTFHAVTSIFPPTEKASDRMTKGMVMFYPPEIQRWFWKEVGLRNYYGAVKLTAEEIIEMTGDRYAFC